MQEASLTTPATSIALDTADEPLEVPHAFLSIPDPKKRAYLIAQSVTPSTRLACQAAGIDPKTAWNWKRKAEAAPEERASLDYLEALRVARELSIASAEDEAWERATVGWKEPVFGNISEPVEIPSAKGDGTRIVYRNRIGVVGEMPKKSDVMLIFMLKGHKPETYRDNVHVSGSMGVVLRVTLPDNGRPRLLPSGEAQS